MSISKDATKTIEGAYQYWDYGTQERLSEIQVFRNFDTALKTAGFTIDYEASPNIFTAHKGGTWYMLDAQGHVLLPDHRDGQPAAAGSQSRRVLARRRDQQIRTRSLYGIHFDTGKATLQPDSEQIMGEP